MMRERIVCVRALTLLFACWNVGALQTHVEAKGASLFSHLEGNSHVAVRRQLALALQHSAYKDSDIAAYRTAYLSEMKARQAVYFLHVSKTAGSFLCECASRNGCTNSERTDRTKCHTPFKCGNCHAPFNWPVWQAKAGRRSSLGIRNATLETCAGTAEYLRLHGVNVEGNERYLISEGLCPQFWNVMILRSPQERLVSNLRMISEDYVDLLPVNASLHDVYRKIPELANNFFIRNLLGKEVYELPLGAINATHLERAKKVLEGFDLVFVQSETLTQRIQNRMGWSCLKEPANSGNTDKYMAHLKQLWTPAEWEELDKNNKLDTLLVDHARMLEETDQAVFDHPLFTRSPISHQALCK